jgi:hypothetical protein
MFKRKLLLKLTPILILIFVFVACSTRQTNKIETVKGVEIFNEANLTINPEDVELVSRIGGLPGGSWKNLNAEKDKDTIDKIVTLVNTSKNTAFIAKDYGSGKSIGYPVSIEIKLRNSDKWYIEPLFKLSYRNLANGVRESTANPCKDRVRLEIEIGGQSTSYTLVSEQLANYVQSGADKDMPYVSEQSKEVIKLEEKITNISDEEIIKIVSESYDLQIGILLSADNSKNIVDTDGNVYWELPEKYNSDEKIKQALSQYFSKENINNDRSKIPSKYVNNKFVIPIGDVGLRAKWDKTSILNRTSIDDHKIKFIYNIYDEFDSNGTPHNCVIIFQDGKWKIDSDIIALTKNNINSGPN